MLVTGMVMVATATIGREVVDWAAGKVIDLKDSDVQ